ncbi:MAG: hypothetical protein HWQ38_22330 [Nostoc sp. NMS7]|uniref:hypothetical protein n=1 Tax=Nostoc sp. NMS7 TaxID=2815391 RepID=UPI0025DAAEE7|nr:hypothetical protein [Nostoc sp. NMS7]MBN3949052.1 hypothetical protein [Nostoc sp. NMS7]
MINPEIAIAWRRGNAAVVRQRSCQSNLPRHHTGYFDNCADHCHHYAERRITALIIGSDRPQETRQRRRRSATQLPVKPTTPDNRAGN